VPILNFYFLLLHLPLNQYLLPLCIDHLLRLGMNLSNFLLTTLPLLFPLPLFYLLPRV